MSPRADSDIVVEGDGYLIRRSILRSSVREDTFPSRFQYRSVFEIEDGSRSLSVIHVIHRSEDSSRIVLLSGASTNYGVVSARALAHTLALAADEAERLISGKGVAND